MSDPEPDERERERLALAAEVVALLAWSYLDRMAYPRIYALVQAGLKAQAEA